MFPHVYTKLLFRNYIKIHSLTLVAKAPTVTLTRRLKSFQWDALVYGSIMAFYLNFGKNRETGKMCHVMSIDE